MKNSFARINFNSFYITNECNRVIEYTKKNLNIKGVNSAFNEIQNVKDNYLGKMKNFINEESNYENKLYTYFKGAHLCKFVCKLVVILTFIFSLFQNKLPYNIFTNFVVFFNYKLFLGGILMWIIAKILEIIYEKRYISYMDKTKRKINKINGDYYNAINKIYDKVDELYLNSLEPALREMILINRKQERQYKETVKMMQKQLDNQQKQGQKIEQEQKRTRQIQEELLEIERERERRYNRYR